MSGTHTYYCEGDLDCPNQVIFTEDDYIKVRDANRCILCPTCKPRYGHLTQKENLELGWNDLR